MRSKRQMNRTEIANTIVLKIEGCIDSIRDQWRSSGPIFHAVIDDLLPEEVALHLRAAFPQSSQMRTLKSLREHKHIAAQMDEYHPLLEEALFAFQDPRVVALIGEITGLRGLEPDEKLYAGGISVMSKGHFLNPHIDNSHDKNRDRYRVLNLLYYVSPDWTVLDGGNLELWPSGLRGQKITIESRFNRLALMVTNRSSWHSVEPVRVDASRCCVSNYYFSKFPAELNDYFHVTSFRGRPDQPVRDVVLRLDATLRMVARKLFPMGAVPSKHFYDKSR